MTRYKRKITIVICSVLILLLLGVGIWQLIKYLNIDPTYKNFQNFQLFIK